MRSVVWIGIAAVGLILAYYEISWCVFRRRGKLCKVPKNLNIVNMGSTYAFYGLDYSVTDKRGYNLAVIPQYLYYDFLLLRKYTDRIEEGADVLIVLPDFVFASDGRKAGSKNEQYYFGLLKKEIWGFDWKMYFHLRWKACMEPFTKEYQRKEQRWQGYVTSREEKNRHADGRIRDWEKNLGIPSVQTAGITEKLQQVIDGNIEIVRAMIQWCREHNFRATLIKMPQSEIMRERIAEECLQVYLHEPIRKIAELEKIRVLDYTYEEAFSDQNLYLNSDCFNEKGRKLFSERVFRDLEREKREHICL